MGVSAGAEIIEVASCDRDCRGSGDGNAGACGLSGIGGASGSDGVIAGISGGLVKAAIRDGSNRGIASADAIHRPGDSGIAGVLHGALELLLPKGLNGCGWWIDGDGNGASRAGRISLRGATA